ncbi:hypothetical protein ACMHYO_16295 [Allopusillimonas ginsengisoli]|uniref:hypothetical protein n=1 Tax=Allopusillimonas ginsengisoli TaxID=453575 RepID=UPI0039C0F7D3
MSENLNSASAMLDDASAEIEELEKQVAIFFDSQPYQRVVEHDARTRSDTHKIKMTRQIPGQFRSKARHIASDIRSSLDHIGYASAIATGKSKPKKASFPFARSADEATNVRKRNCQDLPDEIFDVFWSFQPYLGGDNILWALNELANCNKHRSIVPVGQGLSGAQMIHNFSCDGICHELAFPSQWDTEKSEAILCVVDNAANTNYNIQLGFDIWFGEIDVLRGQPVIPVLKYFEKLARNIVRAADSEGVRIGIFS